MQQSLYARLRQPDTYFEKDTDQDSDGELFTTQQTAHQAIITSGKDDIEPHSITLSIMRRRSRKIQEPITTLDIETDDNSEVEMGKLKQGQRARTRHPTPPRTDQPEPTGCATLRGDTVESATEYLKDF